MKINSLLESQTPASSISNTTSSAPEFGRDDEHLEETTTSGSVATVASPVGSVQRRGTGALLQGIKTSAKFPNSKTVKEADEWEEEGDKFQRFLAYAQKQLKAADPAQRIPLARRLSMWQVKHFGPENNQSYNPNTGAAIQGNNDITPSIRAILEIVNRPSAGGGLPFVTVPPIPGTQQVEIDNSWRLTDEGKQWLAYAKEELEKFKLYSSEFMEVARALSIQQQKKFGRASMNPRDNTTLEISMLIDQIRRESWQATQQANQNVIDAAWTVNDLMDKYNNASPEEKEVFRANVERDYGMSVQEFFDYLQQHDQLPQARKQPAQSSPADDVFAEAKKANTKTARKEFGKRDKKPTLSDKEKESKQSESDRLWAMLQAHIAAAEKDKEVKEANQFFKSGPATTGKFPEPRKPSFSGDQGSKSETLGKDGLIYHWQDPRAKQVNEKSKSQAQFRTMAAVAHNPEFAKKVGISQKVGKEFHKADKKQDYKDLPKEVEETRAGNRMSDMSVGSPKIVHKNGRAVGEIGLDHDPSPGQGPYYMKHYETNTWYSGYDTKQEALADLKHVVSQMNEEKQRLDPKCWKGYKKQGTKMKGDTRVNNCVPIEEAEFTEDKLANELYKDLQIFKKGADKDIGAKAKDKDILAKEESKGLWANIHAKRERIKNGSGEKMRKPGSKGAPSAQDFKDAANEAANPAQQAAIAIAMKEKGQKPKNESNGEYDDEAGSTESNLLTTARAVKGLIDTIEDKDNLPEWVQEKIAKAEGMLVASWDYLQSQKEQGIDPQVDEDWQKANKSDKTDGMSPKAVKAYRRENPGSKLQTAVTTKPSKLKPGSKAAKRRKSFCARMSGNKGPMKDEKGRPTPKAKALRRWNCEE